MLCNKTTAIYLINGPLGVLKLTACDLGVHRLEFPEKVSISEAAKVEFQDTTEPNGVATTVLAWLTAYFEKPEVLNEIQLPKFCFLGDETSESAFGERALHALMRVGFGEKICYSQLAENAGSIGASRAAGQALRGNKAPIMIPCHRIIRKSGEYGKFAGGTLNDVKVWLLKHEEKHSF